MSLNDEENAALGINSDRSIVIKFGRNSDIDTGVSESLWNGSVIYPWSAWDGGAKNINVVATDANDTAAGTGARTGRVFGLDANYEPQQEDFTFNGLTPVALTNTYVRIFRYRTLTAGSLGHNAGDISFTIDGSGTEILRPPALANASNVAFYTVPAGYTGLITKWESYIGRANAALSNVQLRTTSGANGLFIQRYLHQVDTTASSHEITNFDPGLYVQSRSDIDVVADTTANNTVIGGGYVLKLVKGEYPGPGFEV